MNLGIAVGEAVQERKDLKLKRKQKLKQKNTKCSIIIVKSAKGIILQAAKGRNRLLILLV